MMEGVRTSFRRKISIMSRYSRTLSNSSTGRSERPPTGMVEDKKTNDGDDSSGTQMRDNVAWGRPTVCSGSPFDDSLFLCPLANFPSRTICRVIQ